MSPNNDTVDKLVIFLAKRDGIDKLVKTFQYLSKLLHYQTHSLHPSLAQRAKLLELASGLSRKAFRFGRFLSGFNSLRRSPSPNTPLPLFANAAEMVYFFFDHFLFLSRARVLDPSLAPRFSFVSAFGEAVGYVFFILVDLVAIRRSFVEKRGLVGAERVMRVMSIAANLADLIIAMADVEPNRFCSHAVTLGVSGLVSAWAGWYRNWPA